MAQRQLAPDQISFHVIASSMNTALLQRHVTFCDFGVFNVKCPDSLSSELPKCRTLKAEMSTFHSKGGSTTPVASHPTVATPPELLSAKRHSTLTFSQIFEIQRSTGFRPFFHEEISPFVHSSSRSSHLQTQASKRNPARTPYATFK
jgi:hypothetical protein